MSALAHSSGVAAGQYPRLELVWSQPSVSRVPAGVYWLRRFVVAGVAVLFLVGCWVALDKGAEVIGSHVGTASAATSSGAPSGRTHVVQRGDTLWSVARQAQPSGDVRPLVSRLSAQRDGRPLQIGETVKLPASSRK